MRRRKAVWAPPAAEGPEPGMPSGRRIPAHAHRVGIHATHQRTAPSVSEQQAEAVRLRTALVGAAAATSEALLTPPAYAIPTGRIGMSDVKRLQALLDSIVLSEDEVGTACEAVWVPSRSPAVTLPTDGSSTGSPDSGHWPLCRHSSPRPAPPRPTVHRTLLRGRWPAPPPRELHAREPREGSP